MSHPWFKFYPQDWMGDPKLRACSLAARGLWMEMISLAHEATPYGHVLVNGNAPDTATLARMVGADVSECEALIAELDRHGVFSRTRKGVIYSRRMTKDAKKAAHARKIGKQGGNPKLCNNDDIRPQDNPPLKGEDKPHIPDARSQIPEEPKEQQAGGADAPGDEDGKYAFSGRVIRLVAKDYDRWRKAYPAIADLRAELTAADDYYRQNPPKDGQWFFAASNWLRRANERAVEQRRKGADEKAIRDRNIASGLSL